MHLVLSRVQFLFRGSKGLEGPFDIFVRMSGGWHKPLDDMSFGDYGIDDDGTKDMVILA